MSMYGDDEHGYQMNNIYEELRAFLENNPISELLQVLADVVRDYKEED